MPVRPDHGRQIAAARAMLGITGQALADAAGLHKQSIVQNEKRGRAALRLQVAENRKGQQQPQ